MYDLPKTLKVVIAGSRFLTEDSLRHHIQVLPEYQVYLYTTVFFWAEKQCREKLSI